MRFVPTDAEKVMWWILTSEVFARYKFRRQHPMAKYVADFFSHPLLLVIELDGDYHLSREQMEVDIIRNEDMEALGVQVLRFTNEKILKSRKKLKTNLKLS